MSIPPVLRTLLTTTGPSGYEGAPARVWREAAEGFAEVSPSREGLDVVVGLAVVLLACWPSPVAVSPGSVPATGTNWPNVCLGVPWVAPFMNDCQMSLGMPCP